MTFAARTFQTAAERGAIQYTFAANAADQTLDVTSGTAPAGGSVTGTYAAGNTDVTIVVNSGVYIYAQSVSNPALALTGGSGTDVITITNNGYIMGCGGVGGGSAGSTAVYAGPVAGGIALKIGFASTIVKGVGSSPAGGGAGAGGPPPAGGGGGAGGGNGGSGYSTVPLFAAGGAPGGLGSNGITGATAASGGVSYLAGGGGGGRAFPGSTSGLVTNTAILQTKGGLGGTGGGGGGVGNYTGGVGGGGGGGWGASGGTGFVWSAITYPYSGGNGGGTNSAGTNATTTAGTVTATNAGAAGGKAIDFSGFSVTISGTGTTYGATS